MFSSKITWLCDSGAVFHHSHRSAGRFIPVFSIAGVARFDARKAMSRLDASGSFAPFTKTAANTWTNWISAGIVLTKSTPGRGGFHIGPRDQLRRGALGSPQ
jgi:hypothetical protein